MNNEKSLVIGNGPDVLQKEYGKFIDNYFHTVIRCNNGPIEKYEKYVGTKTTCRITFTDLLEKIKVKFPEEKNILVSIPNMVISTFRHFTEKAIVFKKKNPEININLTNRELLDELYYKYQIKNPSVGFVALFLKSDSFTIPIYYIGFDGYTDDKSHYYHLNESINLNNKHKYNANKFHNIEKEKKILKIYQELNILIHLDKVFSE